MCMATETAQKQCLSMQMFEAAELENAKEKKLWCAILTAATKPSSIEMHKAEQHLSFYNA